jgi:preprotein translocase subunit YajC
MKTNMKNIFNLLLMGTILSISIAPSFIAAAHAEDTVSAPPVVAPAQPAGASNVAGTTATVNGATRISDTPVAVAAPNQPSLMGMALPFVIMLTIMYFLMIRPQQKKMKAQQSLISELKSGDEVITNAGILGTITGMSEKVVTLEISKNVQMKVLKSQVNQVIKGSVNDVQL